MSLVSTDFRLRIHAAGTDTPSDGSVAFTLADFAQVPEFGGQLIRPTDGVAKLGTWTFVVVDTGGILTSNLADADGRAQLIGRLAETQENRNGGGWATVSVGRLTALSQSADDPAAYTVTIQDERWVERNARVFAEADTAWLWPSGLRYSWRGLPPKEDGDPYWIAVADASGNRYRILAYSYYPLAPQIADWIRRDLVDDPIPDRADGEGNFEHLVAHIDGTDYPVLSFGIDVAGTEFLQTLTQPHSVPLRSVLSFWVWAPGGISSPTTVRLHAPTAPASATLPLHLGTVGGSHRFGYTNPWELLAALYDEAGVRYDSAALAALQADPDYPPMAWRITDPDLSVAEFAEAHIYAPLGVIPFVDDAGRVSPRSVRLPSASAFDPSTAFELNADNCSRPPTFDHSDAELVNSITVEGRRYRAGRRLNLEYFLPDLTDHAADYLEEIELTVGPRTITNQATSLGTRAKTFRAHGFINRPENPDGTASETAESFAARMEWLIRETFDRFGDGPVRGQVLALRTPQDGSGRTPEGLQPGDLVRLNLDTWPNMATNARGGVRIVQIMTRRPGPDGVLLEFLDAGPSLQALATPSLSLALHTGETRHAIDATVGTLATNARAQLRIGFGSGGTDYPRRVEDLSAGVNVIRGLPSGTVVRVQVRQVAPGRIASAWSSAVTVTTASLPAPTSLSATAFGRAMRLSWTPAASGYPIMPVYRPAGGGAWTNAQTWPLPPGSEVYVFPPLAASTSYDFGVRHVDAFGGLGTVGSVTAATSSARKLEAPGRIQVLEGRSSAGLEDLPPEQLRIGYGIHVGFAPTEPAATTVAQLSTASDFSTIDQEVTAPPGLRSVLIFTDALDDTLRYVRLLHRRTGNDDSDPSDVVTSRPTALLGVFGNDAFPGGIASVREVAGQKLEIFLQDGADPNTASASYAWAKNPSPEDYPTVDGSSRNVTPLPVRENLNQNDGDPPTEETFANGDVVLIRVRFADAAGTFGQETLIRHVYGEDSELIALDRLELYNPTSGSQFPLAILYLRAHLRVPSAVASYRSVLKVEPWNYTTWGYDPEETLTADLNATPTAGLLEIDAANSDTTPYVFRLKDRVVSWDLEFYDAVGGGAGAGTLLGTFRVVADVLAGEAGAGQMKVWSTDQTNNAETSSSAIRLGADGKGDGVFRVDGDATVKLRDAYDAGNVSSSWTPDYQAGACQFANMTAATQLQVPTNWGTGRPMNLRITTNGHALTFAAGAFYAADGSLPTLSGTVLLSMVQIASGYVVVAALPSLAAV